MPEDDVDPLRRRRMGVGAQLLGQGLRPDLTGEAEGVGEEETLQGRLAVDLAPGAVGFGPLEGVQRQFDAPEVGDVLAQRQSSVHAQAGKRLFAVVARDQFLAAGLVGRRGRRGPAFLEPARRPEAAAGVVESVGQFVSDGRGDVAVEHGVVQFGPGVAWGGEDGGGEDDLVVQGVVVGVHRVGAHAPFLPFGCPADAGELPAEAPGVHLDEVVGQPARADGRFLVETPFVRVADACLHRGELAEGPVAGGRVHPRVGAQALREDRPDVLGDRPEALPLRRAEMLRHVLAPHEVADGPVLDLERPLVEAALPLRPGEDGALEDERIGSRPPVQDVGEGRDRLEAQVVAHRRRRGRREDLSEARHELGLTHDHVRRRGRAGATEDLGPAQARGEGVELGERQLMVVFLRVHQVLQRAGDLGQPRLEGEDVPGRRGRPVGGVAEVREQARDVSGEGVAHAARLRFGPKVVGFLRQR